MIAALILAAAVGTCGVERWSPKTATDPEAAQVNLSPENTTVTKLLALGAPDPPVQGHEPRGVMPAEFQTYRIEGKVVVAKVEADQDVHLGIQDDAGAAMVVEIPDPACAKNSRVYMGILQARTVLIQATGAHAASVSALKRSIRKMVGKHVRVTGIALLDKLHGQSTGNADEQYTGIELHPVIDLEVLP